MEVVDFFCGHHSEDALEKDIKNGYVSVLKIDGTIVATGCFVDDHITRVYVLPEHQKKGYGTFIMKNIEEQIGEKFDKAYLDASLPVAALYEKLGFEIAFRTVNEAADEKVAFLKLGTLVIETYENKAAALKPGAIDHVAIDVKNIEKVHEMITGAGLNTTQDEVHFLPFWENGVRFFTIEGPNKEKVEFSQYL